MATLKLAGMTGEIPRLVPRLLPESAAQHAENVRLDDGALTPVRQAALVHELELLLPDPVLTIYKAADQWLAWTTVVNAAPGPVAGDRTYYTGSGAPKMRIADTIYPLAVPFPAAALTATVSGTATAPQVTEILFVYTYVTIFDEESEPCPISAPVNWQPGMTTTLSGFAMPATGRGINRQRIYRSQSSASSADLFFIAERTVSSSNFVDTVALDGFGELIPSLDWNAPPDGLTGLIPTFGGGMAAFVGKDLYFSEPNRPHAWPEKYVLSMDYEIVALGAFGNTIVVMTRGQPYLVQGTIPENMVAERVEKNYPCINARGVVDLGYGIAYPSHDGLVVASSSSFEVVSERVMTRTDWEKISPSTLVAGQYNGRYFASYDYVEEGQPAVQGTFILDLSGTTPFLLRTPRFATAMYYDITQSALFMLTGEAIYQWDAPLGFADVMRWKSKRFVLEAPAAYACILVEGTDLTEEELDAEAMRQAAIAEHNAAIYALGELRGSMNEVEMLLWPVNGDAMGNLLPARSTTVNVYADGVLAATVTELNTALRLPPIPRSRTWEVEVIGNMQITQISMASAVRELNTF